MLMTWKFYRPRALKQRVVKRISRLSTDVCFLNDVCVHPLLMYKENINSGL